MLGRDGLAGLTHRSVAAEAGVPLASASYHFDGIDQLVLLAMQRATDDLVEVLRRDPGDGSVTHLADLLADYVNDNRQLVLAEYETYLHVARRPELRDAAMQWLGVLVDTYGPDLDDVGRRALSATIEGICLHAVLTDEPADPRTIEAVLRTSWPH